MPDRSDQRTPFVLGKPIKNPSDFYGREAILHELFQAVLDAQLVSVVGEHRCGNTSIIYQMLHEDVRPRFLKPAEDAALLFALVSCQLASDSANALFRRIARALRRADADADVDFGGDIDHVWLEDYLDNLADRDRRLVLLMDEVEVLSEIEAGFWEWFEVLVSEYDVSIIATSRRDLARFRAETNAGPPFFNLFRSVYAGSFSTETVDVFLKEKTEITDFDFSQVSEVIDDLAGRFPYYIQLAAALFYLHAGGESRVGQDEIDSVVGDFKLRTSMLFEDAWPKLPEIEQHALTLLALGVRPTGEEAEAFDLALQSLEQRGYLVDGRIFSSVFAGFIRQHLRRIELHDETGKVRIGTDLVELPDDERAFLRLLLDTEGKVLTRQDIARAVWPEWADKAPGVPDAKIEAVIEAVQAAIEVEGQGFQHLEAIDDVGYHFQNTSVAGLADA